MYLIVTNNPMAAKEFAGQGEVRLYPEDTYREILVRAREATGCATIRCTAVCGPTRRPIAR